MAEQSLRACRILVVEDEYMLAEDLSQELEGRGAEVIGPAPTVGHALSLLDAGAVPNGAVLDVNLGGEPVYPLADALIERGVPIIFTTGYDPNTLPPRFDHIPKCGKPVNGTRIVAAIGRAIGEASVPGRS